MGITILENIKQCTGCGACQNVCPKNAIKMVEGYHTFLYPEIDSEKCIECQLCLKTCPINHYVNDNTNKPSVMAVQANNATRAKSSSGGIFSVISDYILKEQGCVFGTILDENLEAKFIKAETKDDIDKCRGSKYIQSNTGLIYQDVKNEVESGRLVAFTGCPCHIVALKNYLKKEYANLFLVDILCHGVPSQKLFDLYLSEHKKEKVKTIAFRDKKLGWRADTITINYEKEEPYIRSWKTDDEYEIAFQENIFLRDSCENCKFCGFPRVGDISIGDFWGIEKFINHDGKGTSICFINNKKGQEFMNILSNKFLMLKEMNIPFNAIRNRIGEYYPHSKYKNLFFNLIEHHTFSKAVNMARQGKYDVGIVGIPTVENFGGALTYLGLYHTLKELNYTCVMIERTRDCKHPSADINKIYHVSPFENGELFNNIEKREDLKKLNDIADIFLVGSDQLFHNNLMRNFSDFALLDWVSDNKKKIAYAASFGHDKFTGSEIKRAEMSYYMKKFDAFSFREMSGVELAKNEFDVDAIQVLDPVFLCNTEVYKKLAENSTIQEKQPYIASYILDPCNEKDTILKQVEHKLKKPVRVYSEMFYNKENIKGKWSRNIEIGKIEDRLSNILNSDFMVTDSFHGMCFAIIFHKNFIVINNENRGSTRFLSILNMIGLSDRLVSKYEDILNKDYLFSDIDYKKVYEVLNKEIERSKNWLSTQLASSKKKSFSYEDMIIKKLEQENGTLRSQLFSLKNILGMSYVDEKDIFRYIDGINQVKDKLLIVITAKDTPGLAISEKLLTKLQLLGLKIDLRKAHWSGYIAVISHGLVIHEQCEYQKKLEYEVIVQKLNVKAKSAPLYAGNDSEMMIDGKTYSVKSRGLNFVVYDFNYACVTDSVGFDTHERLFTAKRLSTI